MSLLKSALTVSGLTLVSRVTGVIRDMLIARFFGASAETDAFYVAFRLPNMLRRLFAEGAFQQAFVPMLADVKERSEGEAGTFIDHVFTVLALSVFAASILGVVAAPLLVWAIASGLASTPEAFDLASALTRFMFPYIAFMALTALAASVLNTWKRFAVPAVTPVLLNLSFIGCTVLLAPRMAEPIWALAVAVILGGVLQLGTQYLALCRLGIRVRPRGLRDSLADGDVRRVLKLMVPALFGVGVAQLSILINTNIASHLGKGAVTWLNYADRLMEFPTALLGVALGTVLLPGLSSAYAKGDTSRYNSLLDRGLRLVVLVAVPAAVGLWLTSEALVSFLFQGRSFTPDDVSQTALAVVGYSVGLIGLIALKIVAPAFYARKDIRTPVKTAFWSLVVVQLVNLVSVPLFSHAGQRLQCGYASDHPDAPRHLHAASRVGEGGASHRARHSPHGCGSLVRADLRLLDHDAVAHARGRRARHGGGRSRRLLRRHVRLRLAPLRPASRTRRRLRVEIRNIEKGKGTDSRSAPFPF